MNKKQIEEGFIESWKPLFERYSELNALPVYAWGRFYKYECAGSPFESCVNEDGFMGFKYHKIEDIVFDWNLLEKIDKTHNQSGGEIWNGDWGDFSPSRKNIADVYDFDDRFGRCLVIEKINNNEFKVSVHSCDSRE